MKITTEPLENHQLLLTIELSEKRSQQAKRQVARRISGEVNISGFRKGKAPYNVIVQRFGEDTVLQEIANSLADEVYREALEQEEIEAYATGVMENVVSDPITFTFTVPLRPTVDLGDYRSYRLPFQKVEVSAETLQQALEEIREQNVILVPIDRPAALGDMAAIDLVGQTTGGVEFLKEDNLRILLDAESANLTPGFAEAVVGMEEDEERTSTLTLPDDFPQEDLQGQEAEFNVKLTAVYERILPELDDDLARTVGSFDAFEELEEHVRKQLLEEAQKKADSEYTEQVLKDIVEQAQIEYPPIMLERSVDEAVENYEQLVKRQAHLALEDYMRIQGQTMEELREELDPRAAASIERALVVGEIIVQEELDVDKEEISTQIEKISASWGDRADEMRASLDTDAGRQELRNRLLGNKAVQRLVASAKGEIPELASAKETEEETGGAKETEKPET